MRILHVAAIEAGRPSGPATSVPLQMRAELGAGHRVGFLQSYGGAPAALPPGVTVLGGWSPTRDLRSYCERAAFWPDLVHFHSVYLVRHAVLARAARRLGLPTISSPRGGLMPRALARSALKKRVGDALFFDAFSRGLTLHRALCEAERAACVARYPGVPARVAGNPVDLAAFPRVDPPRADQPATIGYLGRLDIEYKGLDLLVAGLGRAVSEHGADLRLRICGPDDRGDARRLERLIALRGLTSRVELVPPAEGVDRLRFLESLDAFVHPSRSEGVPMGVLEAMAMARPVVVTPETNLSDVVARRGAGWVVAGSVASVADALAAVARSGADLPARGAAARRAVEEEFTLDAVGAQLTRAYDDAMRMRRADARAA